jgi:hypothetical protein
MPQSFRPLNMEKKRTLLVRGEETTTPQSVKASNFHVPGVHVHQENTQFSTEQLMECQLDALLGPGVNPLEGSPNVKLRKLGPKGTLPASNSKKGVEG